MFHKAFKFRIYPNKKQEELLNKHFGCNRFIWNYFLDLCQKNYQKQKKSVNYYENQKILAQLKKQPEFEWLYGVNSQSLQLTLRHLQEAYKNFFNKKAKFPKFKKKRDKQSFTIPQHIKVEGDKIFFPKFKEGIEIKLHRPIEGDICYATFSKTPSGKYYVSLTCEAEIEPKPQVNGKIGIDLGIKYLVVCSNGVKFPHLKLLDKYNKQLVYEQKQLSKKKICSKSQNRQRLKVAVIHEKISNTRKDYLHKLSSAIINENQVIVAEELNIKGMGQNHHLAKSINDCAWGELIRQIKYKAEWYGRKFVQIERFFPSSQICSVCGYKNENLTLNDREWICPKCNTKLDRDINASKNILQCGCGTHSHLKQKQQEAFSVEKSMNAEANHFNGW